MKNLDITTTTATQSASVMSACGHAFGDLSRARIQEIDVPVQDRLVAVSTKGAFPGNNAWSPPIC